MIPAPSATSPTGASASASSSPPAPVQLGRARSDLEPEAILSVNTRPSVVTIVALLDAVSRKNLGGAKAGTAWYNVSRFRPLDLGPFEAGSVARLTVSGGRWLDAIEPATVRELDGYVAAMVDELPDLAPEPARPSRFATEQLEDEADDLADAYEALDELRRAEDAERVDRERPAVPDLPGTVQIADHPDEVGDVDRLGSLGARAATLAAATSLLSPYFTRLKLDPDPAVVVGVAETFAAWLEDGSPA